MDKYKKINIIETITFILGWTVIFLLGADFPPPSGFWKIILLVIILALIQSRYLKYLLKDKFNMKLFFKNIIFFFIGGICISCSMFIFNNRNVFMQASIIWIAVVTTISIVYGILFWLFNYFIQKR